jgi:hypothetical protein
VGRRKKWGGEEEGGLDGPEAQHEGEEAPGGEARRGDRVARAGRDQGGSKGFGGPTRGGPESLQAWVHIGEDWVPTGGELGAGVSCAGAGSGGSAQDRPVLVGDLCKAGVGESRRIQ